MVRAKINTVLCEEKWNCLAMGVGKRMGLVAPGDSESQGSLEAAGHRHESPKRSSDHLPRLPAHFPLGCPGNNVCSNCHRNTADWVPTTDKVFSHNSRGQKLRMKV